MAAALADGVTRIENAAKEPEIVDAEPDEDQRPPERRRPQLER